MANEITLGLSLAYQKGTANISIACSGTQLSVTGSKFIHNVQAIGTSVEAISIGDIGTAGYMVAINRDATNFITIRAGSSGADVIKLKAGEWAMFRLATSTPYAIADTGACNLEYLIIET